MCVCVCCRLLLVCVILSLQTLVFFPLLNSQKCSHLKVSPLPGGGGASLANQIKAILSRGRGLHLQKVTVVTEGCHGEGNPRSLESCSWTQGGALWPQPITRSVAGSVSWRVAPTGRRSRLL